MKELQQRIAVQLLEGIADPNKQDKRIAIDNYRNFLEACRISECLNPAQGVEAKD